MKEKLRVECPPIGPTQKVRIALVGQAPGADEVSSKPPMPFVGQAGQELNRQLQRVGIKREECYITNVVKRKLFQNDIKPLYEDSKCTIPTPELSAWWDMLQKELEEIKPNVIVALGYDALIAVTGISGAIGKYRGSILEAKWGAKTVPTYHPSGIIRDWEARPLALADLRKAKRESLHPNIVRPKRDFCIRPTLDQVVEYVGRCKEEGLVSVDIETQWSTRISCIGLSYSPDSAICVPFYDEEGTYWNSFEYGEVLAQVRGLLGDPEVKKVFQNGHYDMCWLERDGLPVRGLWFDTMVAMHCAHPQMPKDLATLASLFTNEPYWKDEGKDSKKVKDWEKYWRYNAKDVAVTLELVKPLQNEIEIAGAREVFDFEMSLLPTFVKHTLRGMRFDNELRKEFRKLTKAEIKAAEEELDGLLPERWVCVECKGEGTVEFGRKPKDGEKARKECKACGGSGKHINVRSTPQLTTLIYDYMRLPKVAKKGIKSADEDTLLKLQAKYPNPLFQKVIDIRGLSNRLGFLGLKTDSDGRIRTTLSCTTYTGRLASSGSPFGTGRNLQNVTHSAEGAKISKRMPLRKLFLPDEGKILFGPDYSKAEAYVVAYESGDAAYIDALENGDIHKKNASVIFNKPQADVTYEERQIGKRIAHGLNYCMGDRTLVDYVLKEMGPNYAITQKEAKRFREAYFEEYAGLREFQNRIKKTIEESRTLVNSFGRRCVFLGRPTGKTIREAVAFLPQSTVGDLCNRAIKRVESGIPEVEFLLQVHDQLLLQGDRARGWELGERIVEAMTMPIVAVFTGMEYVVPVEMQYGENWEELKSGLYKEGR